MAFKDLTDTREAEPRHLVTGRVANNPAGWSDKLYVTIPIWDPQKRWGPCAWTPHQDSMPTVGTVCLVAFDENDLPWVVQWVGPWTDVPD